MEEESNQISLPNELVIKVLKYAHPSVIINLSLCDDIHLKSFTFVPELLRDLHFCDRTCISASNLREFLKSIKRRKEIECLCVRGHETLKCDMKGVSGPWTRLKKLDISHCGVDVTELFSILNHQEELEEISWTAYFANHEERQTTFPYPSFKRQKVESVFTDFQIKKLKTVNLEVICANINNVLVLLVLFKDIINLRIRVSHSLTKRFQNTCLSPLDTVDLKTLEKSCPNGEARFQNLKEFSLTSDSHQRWGRNFPLITHVRCVCSSIYCFVKYRLKDGAVLDKSSTVIQKELNFENDLDWIQHPFSLPLINIQSREINDRLVSWINCYGSYTLRSLALSNCHSDSKKLDSLSAIFDYCPCIEELNLDGYFDTDPNQINCQHISKLKNLKSVALSDVLICRHEASTSTSSKQSGSEPKFGSARSKRVSHLPTLQNDAANNQESEMKFKLNYLSELERLEEVEIRSVVNTSRSGRLFDADLLPISTFTRLKSLTLSHLSGVISGSCFRPIFTQCPYLELLRIYHLEFNNSAVCSYQHLLSHSLSLLTNLRVLSLHHSQLDLTKSDLWNPLGQLRKLNKLCLGTNKHDSLDLKLINSFLNRVRDLNVIHIHSKTKNFKQVEKSIKKHSCFDNKPNCEIVIHDLTTEQNLIKVTEWSSFVSSVENKKTLCWGQSLIGYYETRNFCHH